MSLGWSLRRQPAIDDEPGAGHEGGNDSDNPNVAVDNEYNMSASRDIEVGEELTIHSSKFGEQPYKTRHSEQ